MKNVSKITLHPNLKAAFAAVLVFGSMFLGLYGKTQAATAPAIARILPPNSQPYGMEYGEWSGAWIRWAFSIPAPINPILDLTGEHAAIGQTGPVWFLGGTFGGPAVRQVTVPAGKALFFPIAEQGWSNTPEFGDPEWSPTQEAFARSVIAQIVDSFENLSCEIDGQPVTDLESYRFQTPAGGEYYLTLPDNSVWLPAGTYGPSVDDGYWLMIAPLPPGEHTIHFTADLPAGSFGLDVTYHLTVAPGNRAQSTQRTTAK